jgi:phosphatidylglycerophosphatase A
MISFFNTLSTSIVTGFGLGYFPAPGTVASFFAYGLLKKFPFLLDPIIIIFFSCISFGALFLWKLLNPRSGDPGFVVIDEIYGYCLGVFLMPYLNISCHPIYFLLLFRYFDIVKPCGIMRIDSYHTVFGIMLDDCAAALCALALIKLYFLICFF